MQGIPFNPYSGLAESIVTSNLIDSRDAFDLSVSFYTTAGSTSTFTFQLSNSPERPDDVSATVGWSNFTTLRPSTATLIQPPLGTRYLRIQRTVSDASLAFAGQKVLALR